MKFEIKNQEPLYQEIISRKEILQIVPPEMKAFHNISMVPDTRNPKMTKTRLP